MLRTEHSHRKSLAKNVTLAEGAAPALTFFASGAGGSRHVFKSRVSFLIIYMKKNTPSFDWLKRRQFSCNTAANL